MIKEALKQLHLDRRLADRLGWISPADLEREIEALPDVAHKIAPKEDGAEQEQTDPDRAPEAAPVAE